MTTAATSSKAATGGDTLRLVLYALPDCPPCQIVKEALADSRFDPFHPVVNLLSIDEVRTLRKQLGRLSFPILVAKCGEEILGRRIGSDSADKHQERAALVDWISSLDPVVLAADQA